MSPRIKICKEVECNDQATTKGFCRFHYLKNWNRTRTKKKKAVKDLNRYVEHVVKKHPDDYLHEISKDVSRWQEGAEISGQEEMTTFDDLGSGDTLDRLIDNLKVDDEY